MSNNQDVLVEQLADCVAATMLVLRRIRTEGNDSISVSNAIEFAENALEAYFQWEAQRTGKSA